MQQQTNDLRIKFLHIRRFRQATSFGEFTNLHASDISPNGGTTIAYVIDNNYNVVGFAKAKCHEKDHYNKKVGRAKAEGRLRSSRYYEDCPANLDEQQFIEAMYASN